MLEQAEERIRKEEPAEERERKLEEKKRNKQEYLLYSLVYEGYFRTKRNAKLGVEGKNIF